MNTVSKKKLVASPSKQRLSSGEAKNPNEGHKQLVSKFSFDASFSGSGQNQGASTGFVLTASCLARYNCLHTNNHIQSCFFLGRINPKKAPKAKHLAAELVTTPLPASQFQIQTTTVERKPTPRARRAFRSLLARGSQAALFRRALEGSSRSATGHRRPGASLCRFEDNSCRQ